MWKVSRLCGEPGRNFGREIDKKKYEHNVYVRKYVLVVSATLFDDTTGRFR